jgi:hypothetical protein
VSGPESSTGGEVPLWPAITLGIVAVVGLVLLAVAAASQDANGWVDGGRETGGALLSGAVIGAAVLVYEQSAEHRRSQRDEHLAAAASEIAVENAIIDRRIAVLDRTDEAVARFREVLAELQAFEALSPDELAIEEGEGGAAPVEIFFRHTPFSHEAGDHTVGLGANFEHRRLKRELLLAWSEASRMIGLTDLYTVDSHPFNALDGQNVPSSDLWKVHSLCSAIRARLRQEWRTESVRLRSTDRS